MINNPPEVGHKYRVVSDTGVFCYRGCVEEQQPNIVTKGTILVHMGNGIGPFLRFHVCGDENDIVELRSGDMYICLEEAPNH